MRTAGLGKYLHSAFRGQLVQRPRRAGYLGGLERGLRVEVALVLRHTQLSSTVAVDERWEHRYLQGMTREGGEELLLNVADGVHGHLDGVDALVRQARVEHFAQLPLRRVMVCVYGLQCVHIVLGYSIDKYDIRTDIDCVSLFVRAKNS